MESKCSYGAPIERGVIVSADETGYIVASRERDGIESRPIQAMGGAVYSAGDKVLFCLFHDGTGIILAGR